MDSGSVGGAAIVAREDLGQEGGWPNRCYVALMRINPKMCSGVERSRLYCVASPPPEFQKPTVIGWFFFALPASAKDSGHDLASVREGASCIAAGLVADEKEKQPRRGRFSKFFQERQA